jgi:hypothetical protein
MAKNKRKKRVKAKTEAANLIMEEAKLLGLSVEGLGLVDVARLVCDAKGFRWPETFNSIGFIHKIHPKFRPELRKSHSVEPFITYPEKLEKAEPKYSVIRRFYDSWDWKQLRYKAIKKHGRHCLCCGAVGGKIVVDHIKPLRFFWDLRLDLDNLQVLCDDCNKGKGHWDRTDWRLPGA